MPAGAASRNRWSTLSMIRRGTGSGSAATAKIVTGTVVPGFTIGLTMQGKRVTKLKAGTPYRFVIRDRAAIHDSSERTRS
jgi:hypothetical protein